VARDVDRLTAAGVTVLVVVQAEPDRLAQWISMRPIPFPVVSDPERTAYRAFDLGRVGWLHFARPNVLGSYLRLMLRGHRLSKPVQGEDVLQLGGDFVLDRNTRLVFAHPSRAATDRPTVAEILTALPGNSRKAMNLPAEKEPPP
jgi:hypothetical protein